MENKYQNGFTLLETIVAVGLITVGLISALALISSSLFYVSSIEDRLIAANLAGEGIEIVRNIRDNNWLQNPTDPTKWNLNLSNGDYQASYNSIPLFLFITKVLCFLIPAPESTTILPAPSILRIKEKFLLQIYQVMKCKLFLLLLGKEETLPIPVLSKTTFLIGNKNEKI